MICPTCTRGSLILLRESKGPDFTLYNTKCDNCGIKWVYPADRDVIRRLEAHTRMRRAEFERGEA